MSMYVRYRTRRRTHGGTDLAPEGKPLVIALEEHYDDPELAATFGGPEGRVRRPATRSAWAA
jgi:hypothetical protein